MTTLENAESVRAHEAVVTFDATDHLSEHGLTVANSVALEAARGVVTSAVAEALGKVNDYLRGMQSIRQNPYRDVIKVGGKDVRFAAPIDLFAAGSLKTRIDAAFADAAERGGQLERPRMDALSAKIVRDLTERLDESGFSVEASEPHADGSLSRIAVRDPVYVEQASRQRTLSSTGGDVVELDQALRKAATKSAVPSDMGVTWVGSADRYTELHKLVDGITEDLVQRVSDHLRSALAVGLSPFRFGGTTTRSFDAALVDARYVRHDTQWNWYHYGQHASIALMSKAEILGKVTEVLGTTIKLDEDEFYRFVSRRLADRLKDNPELRAAFVERKSEKAGAIINRLHVVCVSELPKLKGPGAFERLLAWLRIRPLPEAVLALPPPSPKPLGLPAPPNPW